MKRTKPLENGTAFLFFQGDHEDHSSGYNYVLGQTYPLNLDLHPRLKNSIDEGSDHLFLYTDGILNAENPEGEAFGYDRMIKAISGAAASDDCRDKDSLYGSLRKEVGAVQDAVFEFAGEKALSVDITMLALGHIPE